MYLLFRVGRDMALMCFIIPPAVNSVYISAKLSRVFSKDNGQGSVSMCINFTGMSGPHNQYLII